MSECVLKTLACRGLRVGPSKIFTPYRTFRGTFGESSESVRLQRERVDHWRAPRNFRGSPGIELPGLCQSAIGNNISLQSTATILGQLLGRLIFIHHQCWEVLPFCRFQRQRCIKILCPKDPDFYTLLALKTAKGQHLPALVVYKNQSSTTYALQVQIWLTFECYSCSTRWNPQRTHGSP